MLIDDLTIQVGQVISSNDIDLVPRLIWDRHFKGQHSIAHYPERSTWIAEDCLHISLTFPIHVLIWTAVWLNHRLLGHRCVITPYCLTWLWFVIHVLILMLTDAQVRRRLAQPRNHLLWCRNVNGSKKQLSILRVKNKHSPTDWNSEKINIYCLYLVQRYRIEIDWVY